MVNTCLIYHQPMSNYFTPEDRQDLPKNTECTHNIKQKNCRPSAMSIRLVIGYAAALSVVKTKGFGKIKFLLN